MELRDLTEDQWGEIAFRMIFDDHPFPEVAKVMTIDRQRSEDLGRAIERNGGIVPLVSGLIQNSGLPLTSRSELSELMNRSENELELLDRFAAYQRWTAGVAFKRDNPHFVWSKLD